MKTFRYRLPLREPIEVAGNALSWREGVLLKTEHGWGEAAPLPGYSRETLDDVVNALQAGPPFEFPSLRFAWESAASTLDTIDVPVNALLTGKPDDVIRACQDLAAAPCRAVKIKVGRSTVESDVALIRAARDCLRHDQSLRLDANRAWTFSQARSFCLAIPQLAIEYLEEPLTRPELCEELFRQTGLPYALDETLSETDDLSTFPNVAAFVVKPTKIGGNTDIRTLVRHGKPVVLSACFESGVGTAHVARLAHQFSSEVPVGLDTYPKLMEDVLRSRLKFQDWRLRVGGPLEVACERLVDVAD